MLNALTSLTGGGGLSLSNDMGDDTLGTGDWATGGFGNVNFGQEQRQGPGNAWLLLGALVLIGVIVIKGGR
ncbi:hypothetical protein [Ferrimonas balearica]|uniref:hypothetical protein n=1 Tax=Ferrimonas balearica TaxID=44012 RepID=UPI001C98FD79|nr:hypothetical protein [Ferrimonas balearica]MBY5920416.1 hypothetical protein [Ferrimonas balearica]MBY5996899.1 hypothetical protein [Ferrimonas balearica]